MNSYNTPVINNTMICPDAPKKVPFNKKKINNVKRQLEFT